MSLQNTFKFEPSSAMQVANSATVTQDFIEAIGQKAESFVGHITFGNLSQTGTLAVDIYTGLESSTAAAWEWMAAASVTASSASALAFTSSTKPLLPYMKVKVSAKAGGAATSLFENIVAKLVTD